MLKLTSTYGLFNCCIIKKIYKLHSQSCWYLEKHHFC